MDARAGLAVVTLAVIGAEVGAAAWMPPPALLVAAPLAALAVACGWRRPVAAWVAVAVAAAAFGAARLRSVTAAVLPPADVGALALPLRTTLTGRVVAAPDARPGRVVLVVEAERVGEGRGARTVRGRVRLAVRRPARRWSYGERLCVVTTLRRPRNFANPGGFDWVGHLARRGIRVTASVWDGARVVRLPARVRGARARLERWRRRLAHAIARVVPAPEAAVLQALVVGRRAAIPPALQTAFARAGVAHVLAISGLHVGLVATAAFALARLLLSASPWLLLRVDVARLAAAASLVPVALYAALAGLGWAALRAAIMVATVVVAGLAGRRVTVLRALGLAALVLALAWPGAPLEASFQLSFVAVAAIVLGLGRLGAVPAAGASPGPRLRAALLVAPCALAGTAPLTALHFHQASIVGLATNPLVVPPCAVAVGLGLGGALVEPLAPGVASTLFRGAGLALRPVIGLVRAAAAPGWAAVDVPIPSPLELALVYGLLGAAVLRPGHRRRMAAALALAGLLADAGWWVHERCARQDLRVTFLDVGQGDAAVVELPGGGVLVVDGGGFPGSDFDVGEAVVAPFLYRRKILHLDAVVMTHAHPDHFAGLTSLLLRFRPREFWWTGRTGRGVAWRRLTAAVRASGARERILVAGAALPPLGTPAAVLHPPAGGGPWSPNDSSLTLRLGGAGVLLTGDVEARAEARLLAAPARLRAAVLKVPHHGSRTSSTPAFVAAVAPRVAVVSVGADNRYGLPAPEVGARYRARGACVLRTDRCGAVTVVESADALRVSTYDGCACPPGMTRGR